MVEPEEDEEESEEETVEAEAATETEEKTNNDEIDWEEILLDGFFLALFLVFLGLDHVEEGIIQQFLLEMLLQIQERHVEQVHRLIEARIDLQLLL